jgi:putative DNA primase/helicase
MGAALTTGQEVEEMTAEEKAECDRLWRLDREAEAAKERREEEERKAAREEIRRRMPAIMPMGHLTLLVGDPGVGKSLVALDYAARVEMGRAVYPMAAGDVRRGETGDWDDEFIDILRPRSIYISAEDSVKATEERIAACGGRRIVVLSEEHDLVPRKETDKEEATLVEHLSRRWLGDCGVVVLDPLPAFLGGFDMRGSAAVRRLIRPLLRLAESRGFAVLGVTHLSKESKSGNMLHRTIGSLAYTALARSVLAVVEDEREAGRKLVVPVKSNLGSLAPAWGFRIVARGAAAGIEWESEAAREVAVLPGGVLRGTSEEEELAAGRLEMALEFLRVELEGGPRGTKEVMREAGALGIAPRTLERARKAMGVKCWFEGEGKRWVMGRKDESGN